MILRLSQEQDEDERPTCLSLDFFSSLMAAQSKRSGTFQILEFARKRERVYSTKLNDGFFTLKVMIVNEAADQLDKGCIKPFFLLQGGIRNHGQGVIVIKEELKFWEYSKVVGQPVAWKLKKENVNYKGSNFIVWSTQKMENLHSGASQIMVDYGVQISPQKHANNTLHAKKTEEKIPKRSNSKQSNLVENISQLKLDKSTQSEAKIHIGETQLQQTQTVSMISERATPEKKANDKRFQSILELLLSGDSSDQQFQIPPKLPSQRKQSTSSKKLIERRSDLQFIFNCLSDSESQPQQQHAKTNSIPENMINSSSKSSSSGDDFGLAEWITKKNDQKFQSISKAEYVQANQSLSIKQNIQQNVNLRSFEDLYHGYVSNSNTWQVNSILKCMQQGNELVYAIICDQNYKYPILAIFIHINELLNPLKENQLYRFGKGIIKQSISHKVNSSSVEIEFDCRTCLIEQIEQECLDVIEPSQNYTPIASIYEMDEGLLISCFGILKEFKYFKGKTGNTLHYELVDPITKWSINYVQFQSRLNIESVKEFIDKPLSIFNAITGSYKNKKNIVRKPFTIVKYDWLPLSREAREVSQWIKNCNSVASLDTQLIGYTEVGDLRDIDEESGTNFFVKSVIILEFKDKFTYRACSTCFKKVEENKCRNCGVRKSNEIEDRFFLRGEIGDSAATMSVIWSNSLAENLASEGFAALKKAWLLRRVSVWIDKGSNGSISIVRMKLRSCGEDIALSLREIKQNLLEEH